MDNSNFPEQKTADNAMNAVQTEPLAVVDQPEVQQTVQQTVQPPVEPKPDRSKITVRGKTIKVTTIIKWAVILLVFLVITNPGIIPFLPESAKNTITTAWSNIFGDVERISNTPQFRYQLHNRILMLLLVPLGDRNQSLDDPCQRRNRSPDHRLRSPEPC